MERREAVGGAGRLAGRGGELATLQDHLRRAMAGSGRLLVLDGPEGAGKSALLQQLRPMAENLGARWLGARGSERERDYPFGVVRQLLEPAIAGEGDDLFDGAAALAVAAFAGPRGDLTLSADFGVLHGLFWLVANLAERRPLVLVVDDAEMADAPSLRFLDHLALRLDGLPVLAALGVRAGGATLTVGPIADLLGYADVHAFPVGPLDLAAVGEFVRERLGSRASDDLVAACHEVTGGNAFLLGEVVGELRRSGAGAAGDPEAVRRMAPPTIIRSIQRRLRSMPEAAERLARAVAVLGDGCELRWAAELAGLDADEGRRAADALVERALLAPGRPLRFAHAVIRTAERQAMPADVLEELHRRAAVMEAARPGGLEAAAAHLLAVEPSGDPFAAVMLHEAARVARRRGAADTASTYLRRALEEPPADGELPGILVDLAAAAGSAGERDAQPFAERALAVATDPALRLRAAREAAMIRISNGQYALAADALARVLGDEGLPETERMVAEGLLLVTAVISADARRAHGERLRAACELAESLRGAAPAPLLALAAFELVLVRGDPRRAGRLLDHALAGGRLLRETTSDSPFPYLACQALMVSGRYELADETATDLIADAAARGSIRAYALATGLRALCRHRQGRPRAAEADARASLEIADDLGGFQTGMAAAALAGALMDAGDLAGAAEALALVPAEARRPESQLCPVVEDIRARLHLDEERWQDALTACEALAAWERTFEVRRGGWIAWRAMAARAHDRLGRRERAVELAEEGLRLAREFGGPRAVGVALRGAGLVEHEPARRVELLRESLATFEQGQMCTEAARASYDLGEALLAAGEREAAREAFAAALATGERAGAQRLEQRARDALVALGARPRRRTTSGVQALTSGERRVAELAAQGMSNREIAERLFLTPKTVETHLTSTYRKLGISSRSQLADRLH